MKERKAQLMKCQFRIRNNMKIQDNVSPLQLIDIIIIVPYKMTLKNYNTNKLKEYS